MLYIFLTTNCRLLYTLRLKQIFANPASLDDAKFRKDGLEAAFMSLWKALDCVDELLEERMLARAELLHELDVRLQDGVYAAEIFCVQRRELTKARRLWRRAGWRWKHVGSGQSRL